MAVTFGTIGTFSSASNVTTTAITKPSGLAVGDLMFAAIHLRGTSVTTTPPAGWTEIFDTSARTSSSGSLYRKVADAGDVAASVFNFTHASNQSKAICWYVHPDTSIVTASLVNSTVFTWDTSRTSVSESGITPSINSMLMMLIMSQDTTPSVGDTTTSTYAIATSNPAWTEQYDDSETFTGDEFHTALATATRPENTATGNYSFSFSANNPNGGYSILIAVTESQSKDGNFPILTMDSEIFDPTISVGTTGSHPILEMDSEIFSHRAKATSKIWTDGVRGTKTWTDQKRP